MAKANSKCAEDCAICAHRAEIDAETFSMYLQIYSVSYFRQQLSDKYAKLYAKEGKRRATS